MESKISLRIPPQSLESEASVLGALLLDNSAFDHVLDLLTDGDFYSFAHKEVFRVVASLLNGSRPADVITVFEQLKTEGKAEEIGGLAFLNALAQYVPSAGNIRRYAEIVCERSVLRRLITAGDEIVTSAFSTEGRAVSDILEASETSILAIGEQGVAREEVKTIEGQLLRFIEDLQDKADHPGQQTGVLTGFNDLDKQTDGFQAGDLIVVAGRPSMGKTSLAMNIAEHAALKQNLNVLVFSLEMSADQLTRRIVGSLGRIDQKGLKTGVLSDGDWGRVTETLERLKNVVLDIQDVGVETVGVIRAISRRIARRRKKLGLIIVDYLQLLNSGSGDRASPENRATEVAQISRGLKMLAKEMQCPVIALSQLNRSVEARTDKRPMMSDLRESGAIEQDADVIIFIYRDEVYTKESCKEPGIAEIIIAKQRNGPTGTVKLVWSSNYTRFDSRQF